MRLLVILVSILLWDFFAPVEAAMYMDGRFFLEIVRPSVDTTELIGKMIETAKNDEKQTESDSDGPQFKIHLYQCLPAIDKEQDVYWNICNKIDDPFDIQRAYAYASFNSVSDLEISPKNVVYMDGKTIIRDKLPQAIQFGIVYDKRNETNSGEYATSCTIKWVLMKHAFEISTCLFFITPMTLITVLYILIGIKLRGSKMLKRSSVTSVSAERKNVRSQNHVIRMLVAVVVAFFFCWAPFHAQRLLAVHLASNENELPGSAFTIFYTILTYTSGILYYLSATINPLLYNIMSKKFRDAFKNMLGQGFCCFGRPALQHRNNSVSRGHSATQSYMDSHLLNNTVHTSTEPNSHKKRHASRIMARLSSINRTNGAAKGKSHVDQELLRSQPKPKPMPKAIDRNNASFKSTLTISNSSLQDLDDSEYSGLELANYMGELNKQ